MREKRFTLIRSQREEMWRRFKQTDDLALTLYYTNSTFAEDPLSEQRIGRLRRLVVARSSAEGNLLVTKAIVFSGAGRLA